MYVNYPARLKMRLLRFNKPESDSITDFAASAPTTNLLLSNRKYIIFIQKDIKKREENQVLTHSGSWNSHKDVIDLINVKEIHQDISLLLNQRYLYFTKIDQLFH